jgi:hypothetical protein
MTKLLNAFLKVLGFLDPINLNLKVIDIKNYDNLISSEKKYLAHINDVGDNVMIDKIELQRLRESRNALASIRYEMKEPKHWNEKEAVVKRLCGIHPRNSKKGNRINEH